MDNDPNQLALTVLQHVLKGDWRAYAALSVLAIVFVIRNYALRPALLTKLPHLAWFKTDKGGVALNFLVSGLGGFGNALAAKQPFTKELLLTAITHSLLAAGVFVSIKRLAGRPAEKTAPPAAPVATPDDSAASTTTSLKVPK